MKNLIVNVSTYDFEEYRTDRFVLFEETILATGAMSELEDVLVSLALDRDDCTVVDGKGSFLLPGLVAGHTHLYSTFARGWQTPFNPHSFQDVLDQLWWKLDRSLGKDEIYYSGLAGAAEFLKNGVTTIIDHHASGKLIKGSLNLLKQGVVTEAGLRGLFCFESSDRFNIDECIEENVAFASSQSKESHPRWGGMFGMHASMSLSDESLGKISLAAGDMPVHVHGAESQEDVDWTFKHSGKSVVERFDQFGLLKPNSLIVHGVHMSDRDFELLKERGCTLVFNPTSNMNNGVGLPPVKQAVSHKIPWMVGNDGLGYNMNRDYQTLLFTYQLQHGPGSFPFDWLLDSINRSYDYVNTALGCKIGRIKKGYEADLFLLPYDSITPVEEGNILGHLLFGLLDNIRPSYLWAGGKLKIRESGLWDRNIYKQDETRMCAQKLWKELKD
jgi:cytosine/adenosine deaminase-related metal-dependent hydrolase